MTKESTCAEAYKNMPRMMPCKTHQYVNTLLTLPLEEGFAAFSPSSEGLFLPAGPHKTSQCTECITLCMTIQKQHQLSHQQ